MKPANLRLLLAVALFAGWIGWLVYLVRSSGTTAAVGGAVTVGESVRLRAGLSRPPRSKALTGIGAVIAVRRTRSRRCASCSSAVGPFGAGGLAAGAACSGATWSSATGRGAGTWSGTASNHGCERGGAAVRRSESL